MCEARGRVENRFESLLSGCSNVERRPNSLIVMGSILADAFFSLKLSFPNRGIRAYFKSASFFNH